MFTLQQRPWRSSDTAKKSNQTAPTNSPTPTVCLRAFLRLLVQESSAWATGLMKTSGAQILLYLLFIEFYFTLCKTRITCFLFHWQKNHANIHESIVSHQKTGMPFSSTTNTLQNVKYYKYESRREFYSLILRSLLTARITRLVYKKPHCILSLDGAKNNISKFKLASSNLDKWTILSFKLNLL